MIFLTIIFIPSLFRLALNYLWFESTGYADVFLVKYKTVIPLFLLFMVLGALILFIIYQSGKRTILRAGNGVTPLWESGYFSHHYRDYIDMVPTKEVSQALKAGQFPVYCIIAIFSVLQGLAVSGSWLTVLIYLNRAPFGETDPIFKHDIAFYVFQLPFYKLLLNYFLVILIVGLLLLAGLYATYNWRLLARMPINIRLVAAGFFSILAVKVYLGRFSILYSETGVVYGAGYTDVVIKQYIPVIISIILILAAIVLLWRVREPDTLQDVKILAGMFVVIFLIAVLGGITAGLLQEFKVSPNELALEMPYIKDNIKLTNLAYDLDDVKIQQYPLRYDLSPDILNDPSITNARLWDYRPLRTTYQQKQAIRTYYGFYDVDIDRYYIHGNKTQVWLSPREIYYSLLPADTWLNRHVKFTHGIGVVMSPGNKIVDPGLPEMYIENIPPASTIPTLTIHQPRIYYGERTDTYIFTGTGREEFDYPSGNTNVVTNYSGTGGINMGDLNKFIAAFTLGDWKILTSPDIDQDSKLHIYRNVIDRVEIITPYLLLDNDAYVVLSDNGHLYWILNAFAHTDKYPYSEPLWIKGTKINYIRDSTKAVVDAYNGTITYYIIEEDPLLVTYSRIFPGVFKSLGEMPPDLQQHLRYSPDLFLVQSQIYTEYHMKIPEVFYNKEDKWQMSKEKYANSLIDVEPYNVLLDLEGSTDFVMMLPFTPSNKDNMIAWMAVNQDPPHYGDKVLFEFPKDKLIYGPAQIEALIDQDEDISKDLTLWSQGGSDVIRGNLLVIPIRGSILYIEPLYISAASSSSIPELKKVLIVYENKVVMADSLEEGIREVIGENGTVISSEPAYEERSVSETLNEILSHYDNAKGYLEKGDLENYAREMKIVDGLMEQIKQSMDIS